MIITKDQRVKLEAAWFVYGNNGRKHTLSGHKFIQGILERGKDYRALYRPDKEVTQTVDRILSSNAD